MEKFTKENVINEIKKIAIKQNFEWLNNYEKAKSKLFFKCNVTGIIYNCTWDHIRKTKKIPTKRTYQVYEERLISICNKYNLTSLSKYVSYTNKIKYKCNKCNTEYERCLHKINKCGICNNFYENNKGINNVTVLRNPYINYKLYFVYIPIYNAYKIGLYKGKYVKSRYNNKIDIIKIMDLPLYKAYYLEQFIINKFKDFKYTGSKFGGYTEAFNNNINKEKIIEIMAASILDVEPRELLEKLEAVNQQPSDTEMY